MVFNSLNLKAIWWSESNDARWSLDVAEVISHDRPAYWQSVGVVCKNTLPSNKGLLRCQIHEKIMRGFHVLMPKIAENEMTGRCQTRETIDVGQGIVLTYSTRRPAQRGGWELLPGISGRPLAAPLVETFTYGNECQIDEPVAAVCWRQQQCLYQFRSYWIRRSSVQVKVPAARTTPRATAVTLPWVGLRLRGQA